jgi:hypothetical protein
MYDNEIKFGEMSSMERYVEEKKRHKTTRSHHRNTDPGLAFLLYLCETTESEESSSDEELTKELTKSVTEDFKTVKRCEKFTAVFHCLSQTFAKVSQYCKEMMKKGGKKMRGGLGENWYYISDPEGKGAYWIYQVNGKQKGLPRQYHSAASGNLKVSTGEEAEKMFNKLLVEDKVRIYNV